MESKNIVQLAVAVLVAVVVFATVLVPITTESASAYSKVSNDGVFNYGIFSPDDEYSMEYDAPTGMITVNGVVVTPIPGVAPGSGQSYSIIATDDLLFRYGHDLNGYYMQIIGKTSSGSPVVVGGVTVVATISNGMLEIDVVKSDSTTQHVTGRFTEMYAIVPDDAEAVMKYRESPAYITLDSEIYSTGLTTVYAWNNAFHLEGSYNGGLSITSPNISSATYENIVWNIEKVEGYKDLYLLSSIEFDIVYDENTTHATYSYFAVPSEVTAEKAAHLSDSESALISVIPILAIVGLIVSVVGIAIVRRYE